MKLALVYSDKRAKYLSQGFSALCEVAEYDLSSIIPVWWQKLLSALISYHLDRKLWQNDFHRNPLAVYFRKISGDAFLKRHRVQADAVLQFGVMTSYDKTIWGDVNLYVYHDGAYDPNNPNWVCPRFGKWFENMQRHVLYDSDHVFTFSKWARRQHITQYDLPERKVTDVGWGPCLPLKNELCWQRHHARRFVFIGNDPWVKGLDILISAFSEIIKSHPDVTLDIIGVKGVQIPSFAGKNICVHGTRPPDDVVNVMSYSDILLLPSRFERAGHVIVEAMWYGLPVVVSDIFGSPEPVLSGNCGIVVKPESTNELTRAITILIQSPDLVKRMSDNAIYESRKNWTWDKVAQRIVSSIKVIR